MLKLVISPRYPSLFKDSAVHLRALSHGALESFAAINSADLQPSYRIPLRYRPYLPGADKHTFPESLQGPRYGFPFALSAEPKSNYLLEDWSRVCREKIDIFLPKYGAVLFRNLPISSAEDFERFFMGLGYKQMDYVGGSAYREKVEKEIYSASDEPPDVSIDLHNEMAYTPIYNKKVCIESAHISAKLFLTFH